jgi:hypothetical protein
MSAMARLLDKVYGLWCRYNHRLSLWPIGGKFRCIECGRLHDTEVFK